MLEKRSRINQQSIRREGRDIHKVFLRFHLKTREGSGETSASFFIQRDYCLDRRREGREVDDQSRIASVHRSLTAGYREDKLKFMDYIHIITIEPGKRSGQPCIRGMRITVRDVLEYLAGGMSVTELIDEFPDLTVDDIRACLSYAAAQPPVPAA